MGDAQNTQKVGKKAALLKALFVVENLVPNVNFLIQFLELLEEVSVMFSMLYMKYVNYVLDILRHFIVARVPPLTVP